LRWNVDQAAAANRARPSLFAIIVGIVTGLGAVLFRARIGLIHNVGFHGRSEKFGRGNRGGRQ
jgi:hypothetical protein